MKTWFKQSANWEVSVPEEEPVEPVLDRFVARHTTHEVSLVAGDPIATNSYYRIAAEGVVIVEGGGAEWKVAYGFRDGDGERRAACD
ncbi:MAG: hypothetical protein HC888_19930, partial [Candidatus Competibacteraceae bacterium]|nr:hypothetical protein [Candidatus Competibacteraceae bacterium]